MNSSKKHYGLSSQALDAMFGVFEQHDKLKRVILYGSCAMGNYRPGSDIDLCLEGELLTLRDLLAIENQLDDLLLPWKMDVSLKHMIDNPDLLEHIEQVGLVLFHA